MSGMASAMGRAGAPSEPIRSCVGAPIRSLAGVGRHRPDPCPQCIHALSTHSFVHLTEKLERLVSAPAPFPVTAGALRSDAAAPCLSRWNAETIEDNRAGHGS